MHGQLSKLDGLYQRHAGQECYIFGDGVSLKWMDLRQFADRPSIVGSFVIYHKEISALNSPYCALVEPFWFWPVCPYRMEDGKRRIVRHILPIEYRKFIIQNPRKTFFINFSNYPVARFSNAIFVSRFYKPPFEEKNPFRDREDSHRGSFTFQISLAIYLGFKKAYLVGQDYTHSPSKGGHFYEKGVGAIDDRNKYFCREFINYAKRNIDLVTVTLDGGSETMDSMTYRDLTGMEPNFRENTEIVDRVKLENIATSPRPLSVF